MHTTAAVILNEKNWTPASTAVEMSSVQVAKALCVGAKPKVNRVPADSAGASSDQAQPHTESVKVIVIVRLVLDNTNNYYNCTPHGYI